jgi:hypothetical protein
LANSFAFLTPLGSHASIGFRPRKTEWNPSQPLLLQVNSGKRR